MNLVDEFGGGNHDENKAKRAFALTKRPTGADYLSSNHVNYAVSNIVSNSAKNVSNYLILNTKRAFDQLRKAFIKASILQHFDPEQYIRVKTDASGHAIGWVLSQLTNYAGQWHPLAYFLRKMIPAKTRYKTYDSELLAIIKAFKTWWHYLEDCKYKVLVFTNHNNLCRFMDIKSLSSRQVWWAKELSKYHFQINYHQGKANGAANALSRFPQQDYKEDANFWAKNTWILHRGLFLLTNASILGLNNTFLGLLP